MSDDDMTRCSTWLLRLREWLQQFTATVQTVDDRRQRSAEISDVNKHYN